MGTTLDSFQCDRQCLSPRRVEITPTTCPRLSSHKVLSFVLDEKVRLHVRSERTFNKLRRRYTCADALRTNCCHFKRNSGCTPRRNLAWSCPIPIHTWLRVPRDLKIKKKIVSHSWNSRRRIQSSRTCGNLKHLAHLEFLLSILHPSICTLGGCRKLKLVLFSHFGC